MNPNTAINTTIDAKPGKLSYFPQKTDVLPATQVDESITSTFNPTNDWLGSLMEKRDYRELNAFFDMNYNHIISKGISYCGIIQNNEVLQKAEKAMNESKLLELYINKVDKDQSDLRSDIRGSEQRTSEKISSIESRMDERLNRIEDLLGQNIRDLNNKFDKMDAKFDSIKTETTNALRWNIGISIATILGIAAMVLTVILSSGILKN